MTCNRTFVKLCASCVKKRFATPAAFLRNSLKCVNEMKRNTVFCLFKNMRIDGDRLVPGKDLQKTVDMIFMKNCLHGF